MKIAIERFKNIQKFEFDVANLCLLVGGNNAGKSSILQAIQFGISVAQTSAVQGGTWSDDRLSTSIGQTDLVYSPIRDVHSLARNGRLKESDAEAIRITYIDGADECRVSVRKGRNKNILLEMVGRNLGQKLQSIQKPTAALVTGLAGIPSEEEFETSLVVRKAAARGDSNSVFRNILLQLKQNDEKWRVFLKQIGRVFPGYSIDVSFNPDIDETISCTVSKGGVVYPIDTCGTGILQAIQIFSYVNLFSPQILLLDEPDSHLHPNNQKRLAAELISISSSDLKVIVSTHSKHLVEALIENAVLVWVKDGKLMPEAEDYDVQALLEIGALNVGERIGNPKYIFLTEDEKTDLLCLLLEANGYDLEECDIISYSGCTQVGTALTLIKHLKRTFPDAKYAIHRDRDFLSDAEVYKYSSSFTPMGVKVLISKGSDIESHFLTSKHLARSCNIEENSASEILTAAFESKKPDLIKKYINIRVHNDRRSGNPGDPGAIGAECIALLTGPNSLAAQGKVLLKGVRDQLRERKITDRVVSSSEELVWEELKNLWL